MGAGQEGGKPDPPKSGSWSPLHSSRAARKPCGVFTGGPGLVPRSSSDLGFQWHRPPGDSRQQPCGFPSLPHLQLWMCEIKAVQAHSLRLSVLFFLFPAQSTRVGLFLPFLQLSLPVLFTACPLWHNRLGCTEGLYWPFQAGLGYF